MTRKKDPLCLETADRCECPPDEDFEDPPSSCWFCGKGRREVKTLIVAESPPGKARCCICNECIGLCHDVIGAETGATESHTLGPEQHAALVAWANELEDDAMARMKEDRALPDDVAPITPGFDAVLAVAQEVRDRLTPAAPPTTWGWATDRDPDHWYIGDAGEGFPTREAAVAAAHAADDWIFEDELWLITGARLRPSAAASALDATDVAQHMEDFVADNYGVDYAEGWPDISPAAELVFAELLEAWADRWLDPLPWRATGRPERIDLPRPHVMHGPDGPVCACGKPSTHQSGWCGTCRAGLPYDTEGCICTETVVGKSECPVHGPPPSLYPCRPEPCTRCVKDSSPKSCDMCGDTGQTCATHARSWSLCKDEVDEP